MSGKILRQAGGEFVGGTLNVAVESSDHGGDVFAADGLVVVIETRPDGVAGLGVAELELQDDPRDQRRASDFLEIVELAVEQIISANAAAQGVDGTVAAGGTQCAEENF